MDTSGPLGSPWSQPTSRPAAGPCLRHECITSAASVPWSVSSPAGSV